MTNDIPEPIRTFIAGNIGSIVQLEALLLLRENAGQSLSSEEVARKLYCQPEMMDGQLVKMKVGGLLACDQEQPRKYAYRPATDELARTVDQLAQIYRERRVAVTTLIYSDSTHALRSFSDAFRFRKDKN